MTNTSHAPSHDADTLFTTADRCDVCGAQAWVRAHLSSGPLLFCAHHARAYPAALEQADRVDDGRNDLFL